MHLGNSRSCDGPSLARKYPTVWHTQNAGIARDSRINKPTQNGLQSVESFEILEHNLKLFSTQLRHNNQPLYISPCEAI